MMLLKTIANDRLPAGSRAMAGRATDDGDGPQSPLPVSIAARTVLYAILLKIQKWPANGSGISNLKRPPPL